MEVKPRESQGCAGSQPLAALSGRQRAGSWAGSFSASVLSERRHISVVQLPLGSFLAQGEGTSHSNLHFLIKHPGHFLVITADKLMPYTSRCIGKSQNTRGGREGQCLRTLSLALLVWALQECSDNAVCPFCCRELKAEQGKFLSVVLQLEVLSGVQAHPLEATLSVLLAVSTLSSLLRCPTPTCESVAVSGDSPVLLVSGSAAGSAQPCTVGPWRAVAAVVDGARSALVAESVMGRTVASTACMF